MPEGDTIFRAAALLATALVGGTVVKFESVYPSLTRVDHDHPLAGRTVESVTARGKHMLIFFSGDLVLHTHLRMHGVWQVYRPGERWRRPARDLRVLLATETAVAAGFLVPVAEFLTARTLARHPVIQALGPDLLSDTFDRDEAVRRMRERRGVPLVDVLLDQRVVAGIGNVFKSEVLFAARLFPFATVEATDAVDPTAIDRLLDVARKQLRLNVVDRHARLAPRGGRRTTNSLHPDKGLWVYYRPGEPCRVCGTPISVRKTGVDARGTYWCARCQPEPPPT